MSENGTVCLSLSLFVDFSDPRPSRGFSHPCPSLGFSDPCPSLGLNVDFFRPLSESFFWGAVRVLRGGVTVNKGGISKFKLFPKNFLQKSNS